MIAASKKRWLDMYYNKGCSCHGKTDYGPEPFAVDIEQATLENHFFRRALWTGNHLQLTLMSIPAGSEIGLEMHEDTDQFLRIEMGRGVVKMGECRENLNYQKYIEAGSAIFVPAGTWHNVMNTGCCPLKIYTIYAPLKHPYGTIHPTKADAEASED